MIKSFLRRDKLLPYIENYYTSLSNKHLDEINEFINSHLFIMAKIIASIRERCWVCVKGRQRSEFLSEIVVLKNEGWTLKLR